VIAPEPGGTPASVAPIGVVFTSVAIFLTYSMTKHRGRRQHPNRPTS
jgi:hypothetical protein